MLRTYSRSGVIRPRWPSQVSGATMQRECQPRASFDGGVVRPDDLSGRRGRLPARQTGLLAAARGRSHRGTGFAYLFEEAVGLDPDPAMRVEGRRVAHERCITNTRWVRALAEDLPGAAPGMPQRAADRKRAGDELRSVELGVAEPVESLQDREGLPAVSAISRSRTFGLTGRLDKSISAWASSAASPVSSRRSMPASASH
jgi:hypothetical protein